jgi:hypothetical protein
LPKSICAVVLEVPTLRFVARTSNQVGVLMTTWTRVASIGVAIGVLLFFGSAAWGYDDWSDSGNGGCAACHGGFTTSPYTSLADGQNWGDSLHNVHRTTMLGGDCDTCHTTGGRVPTFLNRSNGGTGLPAVSCMGCHGRTQDGGGSLGAGLRQHHWVKSVTLCVDCHSDADPGSKAVVGENVKPPYYVVGPTVAHPVMPSNPCNPGPAFNENFAGTTIGLDNDGDGVFDMADSNCSGVPAGPGEAGRAGLANPLLVTAYNSTTGALTISFGTACGTTNNNVETGILSRANLAAYTWSGRFCSVGNTGTASFNPGTGSYFFVVVGNNGTNEGSYGRDLMGVTTMERPEDASAAGCAPNPPQSLANRCDP